jgi:cytochrome c peroxidase
MMIQRLRSRTTALVTWNGRNFGLLVIAVFILLAVLIDTALIVSAATPDPPPAHPANARREAIAPLPRSLALDPKKVALGERLFKDPRLSRDNNRSCATCHPLERGGMDGHSRATSGSAPNSRNTPTIFNVGFNSFLNWDGVADTLEAQAELVLLSPRLMNTTWPELLAKLRADGGYDAEFSRAYSGGLTQNNVLDALASYERSLVTPDSRFDRYLRGERGGLTQQEQQGYALFKSYGCVACHQGINIGGNMYQKFGVFADTREVAGSAVDLGRYAVTKEGRDREVFRVPGLRNVAVTAPYFHDGRTDTLDEAVATMARVQLGRTLTPQEIGLIVQFLHSLTGEYQGRRLAAPSKKEP